jgi:hypothetical protein
MSDRALHSYLNRRGYRHPGNTLEDSSGASAAATSQHQLANGPTHPGSVVVGQLGSLNAATSSASGIASGHELAMASTTLLSSSIAPERLLYDIMVEQECQIGAGNLSTNLMARQSSLRMSMNAGMTNVINAGMGASVDGQSSGHHALDNLAAVNDFSYSSMEAFEIGLKIVLICIASN